MTIYDPKNITLSSRRDLLKSGTLSLFSLASIAALSTVISMPSTCLAADNPKQLSNQSLNPLPNRKFLTIFYSRTDGTRIMAQSIHSMVGGDILEIKPITPYSSDYTTATEDSRREILTGIRTPIQPITIDIASYDVICLGSPRWWGTLSVPILNFVLQNDLSGKTIVPFNTNGGGEREKSFDDLKLLCPKSTILEGLPLSGSRVALSQNNITIWLRKVGVVI